MQKKIKSHFKTVKLAPCLTPGGIVQIIAPASPFQLLRFNKAVTWLKKRGYHVRYLPGIFSRDEYLAGDDQRRSLELTNACKNKNTSFIWAARGGYGSIRILKKETLAFPKIIMGMSDLTILINHIAKTNQMVTVHGPVMAGELFDRLSLTQKDFLFSFLEQSKENILTTPRDYVLLHSGCAKGKLWGGNLSMVVSSLATPFEIPFNHGILFLEEVHEPKYRIDRMFAQLFLAGVFKKLQAVVLGDFLDVKNNQYPVSWLMKLVKRYVLTSQKIPILCRIPCGHQQAKALLPIGGEVRLVSQGRKFILSPLVQNKSEHACHLE